MSLNQINFFTLNNKNTKKIEINKQYFIKIKTLIL